MQPERKVRLSRAALETLAVIAYRQPITRPEIEDLRCVDCGAVLKGLLERGFVRIVGRREAAGRPVLYGTSARFLETFGLPSLRDLPELRELDTMWEERGTPVEEALTARQPQSEAQEDALAGATPLESMEPETRDPQEPEDAPPY
jgi:segregation and condensation protein B